MVIKGSWTAQRKTLFVLRPDIRHPAIVRPAKRQLDARIIGNRPQKKRRIKHLYAGADFVHVFQARIDVRHLARLFRSVLADIVATADQAPADDPKILRLAGRHVDRDRHRPIALIVAFQVIPSLLAFDHVRVGIDR